jgi:pimeloyl-ACP methyl ester carboxylesterase
MAEPDALEFFTRPDGLKLAYRHRKATVPNGPTYVFLPGYKSDMLGGKAIAMDAWAQAHGAALVRFDYEGCGESEGVFEDGTLTGWRDDALVLIDALATGPIVLIGSSMGGWLALLVALARPGRVAALIGIAAAPDFTDWGFTPGEKAVIRCDGRLERPSEYGPEPMVTTRGFWESGNANLLFSDTIPVDCPVRLLHGQRDDTVPWETALRLASALRSADVQTTLVKDGDHRLSRDQDIALLLKSVAEFLELP